MSMLFLLIRKRIMTTNPIQYYSERWNTLDEKVESLIQRINALEYTVSLPTTKMEFADEGYYYFLEDEQLLENVQANIKDNTTANVTISLKVGKTSITLWAVSNGDASQYFKPTPSPFLLLSHEYIYSPTECKYTDSDYEFTIGPNGLSVKINNKIDINDPSLREGSWERYLWAKLSDDTPPPTIYCKRDMYKVIATDH